MGLPCRHLPGMSNFGLPRQPRQGTHSAPAPRLHSQEEPRALCAGRSFCTCDCQTYGALFFFNFCLAFPAGANKNELQAGVALGRQEVCMFQNQDTAPNPPRDAHILELLLPFPASEALALTLTCCVT